MTCRAPHRLSSSQARTTFVRDGLERVVSLERDVTRVYEVQVASVSPASVGSMLEISGAGLPARGALQGPRTP